MTSRRSALTSSNAGLIWQGENRLQDLRHAAIGSFNACLFVTQRAQFVVPPLGGIVWRHGMVLRPKLPPKGGKTRGVSVCGSHEAWQKCSEAKIEDHPNGGVALLGCSMDAALSRARPAICGAQTGACTLLIRKRLPCQCQVRSELSSRSAIGPRRDR